jgi:protein involved in polysaccharide export with SLBB domain
VPTNKSRIAVWGEVAKPSVYVIPDGESLAIPGALSLAGGLTDAAEKGSVVLVRSGADGKAVQTVVDMKQYLAGTSTVQMALQPGDVVYVPTKKQSPSTIQILPALGGLASILRLVL